ncbi:MFS transporter [Saprospira grandis]|uniref:Sugar transport protein n=1 Tax=Saprospira grandis (strain Lewin) TaxID=984262 RepID=H6L5H8_SAPGL|nr:MFS transporter [Saprospira grandis]AFC25194.1 sugar transport protein [Saprospira grandis str. Lewin]WBM73298.1 MFS transporter [Saprospira grandis]
MKIKFSSSEKLLLFSLAGAKFTHIMDFMVLMPLGPQLMRVLDISAKEFGVLVSSYTFSAGATVLASAFFIDRLDRKKALLWTYAGFWLGTLACGLVNSYETLVLARILTGLFGGLLNALVLSLIGDVFSLEKRASAMGVVMAAFSAAAAFGVPFGIYMASMGNWRWPFLILALASLPVLIGLWYFIPNLESKEEGPKAPALSIIQRTFSNPNQLRALGMTLLLVLGQFMIIPYISPFMVGNIGFSEIQLVYIYLCGGLLTLFTGPAIGRLADKKGHKNIFVTFAILSILPLLLITHLPDYGIPFALLASSLFFILISGRIIPSTTMVVSSVERKYRAGFMSLNTAMQQLAAGMAALISGNIVVEIAQKNTDVVAIGNYNYLGYLAVGLTFLAIFLGRKIVPLKEAE